MVLQPGLFFMSMIILKENSLLITCLHLKRKLMKGKLNDISKGHVKVDYKMLFPG